MAFLGKAIKGSGEAKADVAIKVSVKNGRIGVVFRQGLVPEGTLIDVLIGTGEDHGKLMAVYGGKDATPVKSLGHKGQSTSWSGVRTKATKDLPDMQRRPCVVLEKTDKYILIDMQLDNESVIDEGGETPEAEVEAPGADIELGL